MGTYREDLQRKFDGKVYSCAAWRSTRHLAEDVASDFRWSGFLVRIVATHSGYLVYRRRKDGV